MFLRGVLGLPAIPTPHCIDEIPFELGNMKISLIVASLVLACFSAQAAPALVSEDKRVDSLIILFAAGVPSAPLPADVIESVTRITKGESVDDKTDALFIRVGAPLSARWLVEHRLTPAQTAIFEDGNKDSSDIRLQQYVLLHYADADARITAQRQLSVDGGVLAVIPNHVYDHQEAFASRPNDTYVVTGPAYSPQGYQWGLEAIRNISPYSNPSLPSGRDLATGNAYVGIVDSGIDTGAWTGGLSVEFADSFRAHFSQSFYSGACTSTTNLTDVDEAGYASPVGCRNTYVGHGTHVAGIIGAKANNATGIAGVCPTCSLIIAKAYQNNNSTAGDLLNGFLHSVYRGAQVINRSGAPFYLEATYGAGVHTCGKCVPLDTRMRGAMRLIPPRPAAWS